MNKSWNEYNRTVKFCADVLACSWCGVVVVKLKATDVDNSVEKLAFALCQCR